MKERERDRERERERERERSKKRKNRIEEISILIRGQFWYFSAVSRNYKQLHKHSGVQTDVKINRDPN